MPGAIAGQYCYRIVGQILFYFALRRKQPSLKALELSVDVPFREAVKPRWAQVRRFDYEALFKPHELDEMVPLTAHAEELLRGLVSDFSRYDWNTLKDDVLGSIFEQLIPQQEQLLLGQFYTPAPVTDLLIVLALDGDSPSVLDPGCGSGTFLLRAYQYLLARISHTVTAEGFGGSVGAEFLPREQVEREQAALRPCFRGARGARTAA